MSTNRFEVARCVAVEAYEGDWNFPFGVEIKGNSYDGSFAEVATVLSRDELRQLRAAINEAIEWLDAQRSKEDLDKVAEEIATDSNRLAVMPPAFYQFVK